MNVVGLFAGIGGIELGLKRAGHRASLICEIDPAACAVLAERFPKVPLHHDVRTLVDLPKDTELLVGGFPCQDISQAGSTKGIAGKNSGLVNEVFRIVQKNQVPNVLLENVSFMLALDRGHAMRYVTSELERLGYRWAYRVIDSQAFGLPQRRQRLFIFASRVQEPFELLMADTVEPVEQADWRGRACGFYWTEGVRGLGWAVEAVPTLKGGSTVGIPSSPAIWMPDGRIVTPDIRDAERLQGFEPGWTEPALQVARPGFRWKLIGNAVSVPAAEWVGQRLMQGPQRVDLRVHSFDSHKKWPTAAFGGPGQRALAVDVSMWPVAMRRPSLSQFLKHEPKLLSYKATAGFVARLRSGNLHFPREFLDALDRHAERMRQQPLLATA
ncbi:MAG TPA: DNA (cytosine-5-)-methyltransferase [Candidatus Synoicihabitans sp.]|nr:DNA (cytosine-5-)-methyltransferase [Candidatus Synoicihabitans sp.]